MFRFYNFIPLFHVIKLNIFVFWNERKCKLKIWNIVTTIFLNKKIINLISLDEKVTEKPTNRLINNENNNNKYSDFLFYQLETKNSSTSSLLTVFG